MRKWDIVGYFAIRRTNHGLIIFPYGESLGRWRMIFAPSSLESADIGDNLKLVLRDNNKKNSLMIEK